MCVFWKKAQKYTARWVDVKLSRFLKYINSFWKSDFLLSSFSRKKIQPLLDSSLKPYNSQNPFSTSLSSSSCCAYFSPKEVGPSFYCKWPKKNYQFINLFFKDKNILKNWRQNFSKMTQTWLAKMTKNLYTYSFTKKISGRLWRRIKNRRRQIR